MLNRPPCRKRRPRRAAAAAEMAVLLPILAFFVVAAADFARAFYHASILTNCARAGALYACDPGSQSKSRYASVTAAALAEASGLSPAPTVVAMYGTSPTGPFNLTSPHTTNGVVDGYVQVKVTWQFKMVVNLSVVSFRGFPTIPRTYNLTRSVVMEMIPSS